MKKKLILSAIIALAIGQFSICNAQTLSPKVTPTSGGYATGGGNSLSFTMGETFNTTLTSGTQILTQGEQQPEVDLITGTVAPATICAGNTVSVPYTASGYYGVANTFTAQLSNASGSFASPVNIGSVTSATSGTITATIPVTTPVGSNYRIRVVSNHPDYIGKMSNTAITVTTTVPSGTVHITSAPVVGCVGGSATVSVNAVAGASFYNFSSAQSGVLFNGSASPYQSLTPSVTISFTALPPAGASGWSVCCFAGNACGNSNNICTWIRSTLSTPTAITGSLTGCPNTSSNPYSTTAVAGASNYLWSGSSGITVNGSGLNVTVDFSPAFVSGTLCVHAQTTCGYNSADRCITISKTTATPGAISGSSYVCPNGSSSFSIPAVANATSYNWTCSVPSSIVTQGGTSCSIAFPAIVPAGSTVSVSATSSCNVVSAVRSKGIASGIPNTPGNISGPSAGQCGQSLVSYSVAPVSSPVPATSYTWTATNGATVSGPNNLSGVSINFPSNFSTATLSVTANTSCGSSVARTLVVSAIPSTPPAITGNTSVCSGAGETYTTAGSTGATSYAWTVPAGAVILGPANGTSVLVQWASTGGTITCKASNTCGISGSRTLAVSVTCREGQVASTGFNAEVFPNPASDKATLKFISTSASHYHLNMTNVLGQNIFSKDGATSEGINSIELDFSQVAKGVYMLGVASGDNTQEVRVVVQ